MDYRRKTTLHICRHIFSGARNTHINYHFTTLAGSYLCEDLQNEGLGDIPGQIPHIPAQGERWGS